MTCFWIPAAAAFHFHKQITNNQDTGSRIEYVEFAQTALEVFTLTEIDDYENFVKDTR